jgi:hypothetical protein
MTEAKLTGGLTNYYLAKIDHPQREEQVPYQAECEDIIRALNMTFDEGCEFKAIWRTAAARLGNGKPGQKALYDCEKRVHYAQASLRQEQQRQSVVVANEEPNWVEYTGSGEIPKTINANDLIQVRFPDGEEPERARRAGSWNWNQGITSRITHFRKV